MRTHGCSTVMRTDRPDIMVARALAGDHDV